MPMSCRNPARAMTSISLGSVMPSGPHSARTQIPELTMLVCRESSAPLEGINSRRVSGEDRACPAVASMMERARLISMTP